MSDAQHAARWSKGFLGRALLCVASTGVALAAAEGVLRLRGTVPGYVAKYSDRSFRRVAELVVEEPFVTDADGVYHANLESPRWRRPGMINTDGFRGREFRRVPGDADTVLFLGDSFTWGIAADPLTDCFVDRVEREGFVTYNTGIPRTHPKQYAVLAARYIPRLKPDVVAVMFYMGNDMLDAPPMRPFENLHHQTNAGDLKATDDEGRYMPPEEAYRHYLAESNLVSVPNPEDRTLGAVAMRGILRTAVGTTALAALAPRPAAAAGYDGKRDRRKWRHRHADTHAFLSAIRNIAQRHGARFELFLIPVRPARENARNDIERNLGVFEGLAPRVPDFELTERDHEPLPGWHFNNEGHRKYAEFVVRVLRAPR